MMFRKLVPLLILISTMCVAAQPVSLGQTRDESLRLELGRAIDKGLQWLAENQKEGGWWSTEDHPALTALALRSFFGSGSDHQRAKHSAKVDESIGFLLAQVKSDGSIYNKDELKNYNTAVSLMAMLSTGDETHHEVIRKARAYLVGQQWDFGEKGKLDDPKDGGIGYGSRYPHSDMSNTLLALEAIYESRHLVKKDSEMFKDLNWEAVIHFVQNSQNLPETNRGDWVSGDTANRGGFVYFPGDSKAGEMTLPDGKVALRSYGSISYAGLLSFIYADLDRDDQRVVAAMEWLSANYTLDENPGMGAQGLFYYYHTMSKALKLYGEDHLSLQGGKEVDWKKALSLKLIQLQKSDGSWVNENARWWENDPVLATAYTLLALQNIHQEL